MNRREWIKSVISAVVVSQIPVDLTPASIPVSLMGIPYHCSDATTGTWLGIVRSEYPLFRSKWEDVGPWAKINPNESRPTNKVS